MAVMLSSQSHNLAIIITLKLLQHNIQPCWNKHFVELHFVFQVEEIMSGNQVPESCEIFDVSLQKDAK